jgi:hypothetical protein
VAVVRDGRPWPVGLLGAVILVLYGLIVVLSLPSGWTCYPRAA